MKTNKKLAIILIAVSGYSRILYAQTEASDTLKAFEKSDPIQSSLFSSFSETKLLLAKNPKISSEIARRVIPEIIELSKVVEKNALEIQMSSLSDEEKSIKIMSLIDRLNIATSRLASVTIGVGKFELKTEAEKSKINPNPQETKK